MYINTIFNLSKITKKNTYKIHLLNILQYTLLIAMIQTKFYPNNFFTSIL